ncbi:MAG TPA: hypothetical protein VGF92_05495 [Stellaceae bacterium]|jgi:hypothetical protein
MKPLFLLLCLALAGCVNVQKAPDGSTCHEVGMPFFHYSDCPAAPAPSP